MASEATKKEGVIAKKKLSYLEAREYSTIEQRVAEAERSWNTRKQQPKIHPSPRTPLAFVTAHDELDQAQKVVDELYARWSELEAKKG